MFYKKGIDICSTKSMFNFLNDHYQYYTLNSWNGLKSIANNVKFYNLDLGMDYDILYDAIFTEDSELVNDINWICKDWEEAHPGYKLGFNGRSAGYLVLYNEKNNKSVLPSFYEYVNDYEDFKQYCKDYHECVKDYKYELREATKLVQDFDKLCDTLRQYVIDWLMENN